MCTSSIPENWAGGRSYTQTQQSGHTMHLTRTSGEPKLKNMVAFSPPTDNFDNAMNFPDPPARLFGSPLRHSNQAFLQKPAGDDVHAPISRQVVFVLLEHFSMMAFTGALDAIVTANLLSRDPLYRFRTLALDAASVRSDLGIQVSADGLLADLDPHGLDMLIVCGGYRSRLQPPRAVLDKLREAARQPLILGSLWNGSYLLAQAGLLDGYACTVHPESRAGLEESHPRVQIQSQPYVIDRNRISCAGANSALGMMLAVIRHHHGDDVVQGIEDILACDRGKDDLRSTAMPALAHSPALPAPLRLVLELMENNIEEPLCIEDLARHAEISARQLDRLFKRHIHASPARYYLELRITRARRLLLQTCDPITSIAVACGFTGAPHFSRCYREFFGQSPSQARRNRQHP
ncbi:HTH-type transcriptional regulator CdhR [Azoarcus sp. Aa7]|nr:HTH-type transcriptional regulator CdhR [Azoarcus sp. Aa7]